MSAFKGSQMNPAPDRDPARFGEIPGFPVGSRWPGRRQLCDDGVHAMLTGGIHGRAHEGAFSVVLSGGYEDDVDLGEEFTYTGSGGQAKREDGAKWDNKQVTDQEWVRGNLALQTSHRTQKPVRVIRGYKLKSEFAPVEGYRYDGLYTVVEADQKPGKSGHNVCLFRFKRCPGQLPLPFDVATLPMRRERPLTLHRSAGPVASTSRLESPDRVASSSTSTPKALTKSSVNNSARKGLSGMPARYKIPKIRPEPSIANYKSARPLSSFHAGTTVSVESMVKPEPEEEEMETPQIAVTEEPPESDEELPVTDSQKQQEEEEEYDDDDMYVKDEEIDQLLSNQDGIPIESSEVNGKNLEASEDLEEGEIASTKQ
ncbi:unnamed protein product [Cyclocybe aegerita]|uniref:YDG domain-containing protein n=1 Tax=Cyclocybe aegerita TaxID=1973307 RepID=A0A8S0XY21_CYCAE|nr:unnamed protein product [Cyclocybe aegerita]